MGNRILISTLIALAASSLACSDEGSSGLGTLNPEPIVPARLDFGEVPLGTSRRLDLVIENVGDVPLQVRRIVPDVDLVTDTRRFSIDTSGFDVLPGQSVTRAIDFVPLADEERTETSGLSFEWNSDEEARVELEGRGVGARLEVRPELVDFGPVLWGSSRTEAVVLTSRHDVSVEVFTRLNGRGEPLVELVDGAGRFRLATPVDPERGGVLTPPDAPLAPGGSLQVELSYQATRNAATIRDQARWTVATCGPSICGVAVPLRASPRPDAFDCAPSTLDFGAVEPGVPVVRTSTCTNVVQEPVRLQTVMLDEGPQGYRVVAAPEDIIIEPDQRFSVQVEFDPPEFALGNQLERDVALNHEKANGDALRASRFSLVGRVGRPIAELSAAALSFPETVISTVSIRPLTVFNRGRVPLTVGFERTGPFRAAQDFLEIAPQASSTVDVEFSPTAVGENTGALTLQTNDELRPELQVTLSGQGSGRPPCTYTLSPTAIAFGVVEVGQTRVGEVTLSNPGPGACLINDVRFDAAGAFSLVNAPSGASLLQAQTSTTVVVAFTPTAPGPATGSLSLYVSSIDASTPRIALSGAGAIDPLVIAPSPVVLRAHSECASPAAEVSIVNPFDIPETVTSVRVEGAADFELEALPALPLVINGGAVTRFRIRSTTANQRGATLVVETAERSTTYRVPIEVRAEETTVQQFGATPGVVDLLFVIGDDFRMGAAQARTRAAAAPIVQALSDAGIDYRIGVVRARVTDANCPTPRPPDRPAGLEQGLCGYLADGGTGPDVDPSWRVINPATIPTASVAFSNTFVQPFRNQIIRAEAFRTARQVLLPSLSPTWNAGFRRPGAPLAVVFVATNDDDQQDLDPRAFVAVLKDRLQGPIAVSTVAGGQATFCSESGVIALATPRLVEAAAQGDGTAQVICEPDWGPPLISGGLPLLGHRRNFTVDSPAVPSSFEVRVGAAIVPRIDPMTSVEQWRGTALGVLFLQQSPDAPVEVRYRAACL